MRSALRSTRNDASNAVSITTRTSGDGLGCSFRTKPADTLITGGEAAGIHEVLSDRHGVTAARDRPTSSPAPASPKPP